MATKKTTKPATGGEQHEEDETPKRYSGDSGGMLSAADLARQQGVTKAELEANAEEAKRKREG